jgi:uncharacterized protein (TIGR04222 family)
MSPLEILDLPGPDFLKVYIGLFVVNLVFGLVLRWLLRGPNDEPSAEASDLSPLEIAYLSGGPKQAIDTAVIRLVHRGILAFEATDGRISRRKHDGDNLHPLERAVYNAASTSVLLGELRTKVLPTAQQLHSRLEQLGLMLPQSGLSAPWIVPMLPLVFVILLGVVKGFVGFSRGKPIGFLLGLLVVSVIATLVFWSLRSRRTRRGDILLQRIQTENAALRYTAGTLGESMIESDLILAVAIFGPVVLSAGPFASMAQALQKSPAGTSGGWSSCGGSSCSSSGCGGGGGCGGGCGGGGCGGCG